MIGRSSIVENEDNFLIPMQKIWLKISYG